MEKLILGLSAFESKGMTEADFLAWSRAGIKCIEVSIENKDARVQNPAELLHRADRYGIRLWSAHLPFYPFDELEISSPEKSLRLNTVSHLRNKLHQVAELGIGVAVIHASGEPIEEDQRQERIRLAQDSLAMLAETAKEAGVTLAVENLPRTCLGRNSQELRQLLEADDALRVCFDTNHLLGQPPGDFIRDLGTLVVTTHISDGDFIDDRHWLPGEGAINWEELIDGLECCGYAGPLLYEVPLWELSNGRKLTYEDFAATHDCLIKRKKILPLGRPDYK